MKFLLVLFGLLTINNIALSLYSTHQKRKYNKTMNAGENLTGGGTAQPGKFAGLKRYVAGYVSLCLTVLSGVPSWHIRRFILRSVFKMEIGESSVIYGGFEIRAPWNIKIGKGTTIGHAAKLDGRNGLVIGNNVNFSTGVWIWTEEHDVNDEQFRCNSKGGKVEIDDRAWISCRTVILPKVHVKEGAVLAAGAVATKDLDAFGIYGGTPAKKIGERNRNLKYEFSGEYKPFY